MLSPNKYGSGITKRNVQEGRSIKNDSRNFKLDSINNTQLRLVRTAGETPVRENSKVVELHNKGSREFSLREREATECNWRRVFN